MASELNADALSVSVVLQVAPVRPPVKPGGNTRHSTKAQSSDVRTTLRLNGS